MPLNLIGKIATRHPRPPRIRTRRLILQYRHQLPETYHTRKAAHSIEPRHHTIHNIPLQQRRNNQRTVAPHQSTNRSAEPTRRKTARHRRHTLAAQTTPKLPRRVHIDKNHHSADTRIRHKRSHKTRHNTTHSTRTHFHIHCIHNK